MSKPLAPAAFSGGLALLVALIGTSSVRAELIRFDFDSIQGSSNKSVQTAMQKVLDAVGPAGATVTVKGAMRSHTYTGDGYVVGPVDGNKVLPYTLGTTDGGVARAAVDGFLMNAAGSDRITMQFSKPIFGVSFDYQIFPNAQVPDGTKTSPENYPDFTFKADGVTLFRTLGVMPGTNSTFAHSPQSGPNEVELAPQFLGQSGQHLFSQGVTTLEFIDWPVKIGIDNLRVDFSPPPVLEPASVPEPGSLALFASGLAGLVALVRRRKDGRENC